MVHKLNVLPFKQHAPKAASADASSIICYSNTNDTTLD